MYRYYLTNMTIALYQSIILKRMKLKVVVPVGSNNDSSNISSATLFDVLYSKLSNQVCTPAGNGFRYH